MYRKVGRIVSMTAAMMLAGVALAQDPNKMPEMTPEQKAEMEAYQKAGTPGAPHQKMAEKAGTYDLRIKMWHEPGSPAEESTGTATRAMMLGDRIQTEEFESTVMGMPYTGHGMNGYDNATNKYWSTWNDSMSTGIMMAEGKCDAKGTCTYTGTSNDPVRKKAVKLRMTSTWTSPTTELFTMYGPDKKGKEYKMMEITYTKK